MSELVTFNGSQYIIPDPNDENWGQNVTDFLVAIPAGALQKTGGSFMLTNDVDFGTTHGLKAAFFGGRDTIIADAGTFRLSNTETMRWRNFANTGNNILGTNTSDQLTYNGSPLEFNALPNGNIFVGNASGVAVAVPVSGDIALSNAGVTIIQSGVISNGNINSGAAIAYSKLNLSGQILNSDIFSSAAIAYSKLNLSGQILNADINTSAAIAYSKLNLTGSILNADINASAAIALSKLAAVTANRVLLSDASGFVSASTVTNTTLGFLDATSSIQTQLNAKQATGNYITALTGDITATGPGSVAATLATVNSNVGTFTNASVTVNAKGLITAASSGGAGSGTVNAGTSTHLAYYATSTNAVSDASGATVSGAYTFSGIHTHSASIAMGANKITGLANGTASTDAAAFGQIKTGVQAVVQATGTTSTSITSDTQTNTVITASITPTSASNRVRITVTFTISVDTASGGCLISLKRGTTDISGGASGFQTFGNTTNALRTGSTLSFIDSPATTSATAYTLTGTNVLNAGSVSIGTGRLWVIQLEEIV